MLDDLKECTTAVYSVGLKEFYSVEKRAVLMDFELVDW